MADLIPDVYDPWWNTKAEDDDPEDLEWVPNNDIHNKEND